MRFCSEMKSIKCITERMQINHENVFFQDFIIICVYLCECIPSTFQYPKSPEEDIGSPRDVQRGCLESNSSSLRDRNAVAPAPSQKSIFK